MHMQFLEDFCGFTFSCRIFSVCGSHESQRFRGSLPIIMLIFGILRFLVNKTPIDLFIDILNPFLLHHLLVAFNDNWILSSNL